MLLGATRTLTTLLMLAAAPAVLAGEPSPARIVGAGDLLDSHEVTHLLERKPGSSAATARTRTRDIRKANDPSGLALQIPFNFDSAAIPSTAHTQLDAVATGIRALAGAPTILIAGHTDGTGGDAYNARLSQQRADAVRAYLVTRGVRPAWLQARGLGSDQPLNPAAPNDAANRRVEVRRAD